jgi:hypothetical protein
METVRKTPGPKPVTISLYPLPIDKALAAFMRVDKKKVKRREQRKGKRE